MNKKNQPNNLVDEKKLLDKETGKLGTHSVPKPGSEFAPSSLPLEQSETFSSALSNQAESVISTELGEKVAGVAGAVWVHNLSESGKESMTIITKEGRNINTPLKPSDVCELICGFMYPIMQKVHGDMWLMTTCAELELWMNKDRTLSEYGITKWGMLVDYMARAIDFVGYGDERH
ncbi:hypothetical protein QTO20_18465 [Serratia marcescens]|uniref:hypothetical protein n=1 Tax=Serratia marcescens TaxID=615 RepID=UPI003896AF96